MSTLLVATYFGGFNVFCPCSKVFQEKHEKKTRYRSLQRVIKLDKQEQAHPNNTTHTYVSLHQVAILRKNLGKDHDDRNIHIDGKGIKILFNHGIRRFMSGQISREPSAEYTKSKI